MVRAVEARARGRRRGSGGSASAGGTFSGWAIGPPSASRRPRRVRSSGFGERQQPAVRSCAPPRAAGPSARRQKPAAHRPVTLRQRSVLANSSATQPPSDSPATCARADAQLVEGGADRPPRSRPRWPRASAGSSGDSPKPGMSTAMQSWWSARKGSTGRHTPRSAPRGWTSTSGGPVSRCGRYASGAMRAIRHTLTNGSDRQHRARHRIQPRDRQGGRSRRSRGSRSACCCAACARRRSSSEPAVIARQGGAPGEDGPLLARGDRRERDRPRGPGLGDRPDREQRRA